MEKLLDLFIEGNDIFELAEREGFEPSEHLVGIHAISSRAPSATRASLHSSKK